MHLWKIILSTCLCFSRPSVFASKYRPSVPLIVFSTKICISFFFSWLHLWWSPCSIKQQCCGGVSEWELWRIGGWLPIQLDIKTNLSPPTALYIKCLESFIYSKVNSFSLENQVSVIFIKKILILFWSIGLKEFILNVALRYMNGNLLIRISLKNRQNSWKAPGKVFIPKDIPSTWSTSQPPSSMFMYQPLQQMNIYPFNLIAGIVSPIIHLSYIIRSHIETITINSFVE